VVKVGSRAVAHEGEVYARLAEDVARARAEGRAVVLVSSGAIALGTKKLGYRARPREMARLQAAAAAGQSVLMRAYEEAFGARGVPVAQVLLTHADLANRERANNARAALVALLDAGAVPILNENDSVAVDEIRFGDNDQLSSMVVPLVDADLLVLLSDVEGLLDAKGRRVPFVRHIASEAKPLVRASSGGSVGSGGMESKLEAAHRATLAGAHVVIADARESGIVGAVLAGRDVGTCFIASERRLTAKRSWIAFTLRPRGEIVLDRGAAEAVCARGRSVLPVGVLGVRGDFRAGDSVRLLDPDGLELGRGLARAAAVDAVALAGKAGGDVLVHRDDMVIWPVPEGG
jgi:glutamate 5-kinase